MEEKNAKISSVSLRNDEHGMLSAWLMLDYAGSGQGFGGYALYQPKFPEKSAAGFFIWRVMEVVGVSEWSSLKGQSVRVRAENHKIHSIGHFLQDKWFNPGKELG